MTKPSPLEMALGPSWMDTADWAQLLAWMETYKRIEPEVQAALSLDREIESLGLRSSLTPRQLERFLRLSATEASPNSVERSLEPAPASAPIGSASALPGDQVRSVRGGNVTIAHEGEPAAGARPPKAAAVVLSLVAAGAPDTTADRLALIRQFRSTKKFGDKWRESDLLELLRQYNALTAPGRGKVGSVDAETELAQLWGYGDKHRSIHNFLGRARRLVPVDAVAHG